MILKIIGNYVRFYSSVVDLSRAWCSASGHCGSVGWRTYGGDWVGLWMVGHLLIKSGGGSGVHPRKGRLGRGQEAKDTGCMVGRPL